MRSKRKQGGFHFPSFVIGIFVAAAALLAFAAVIAPPGAP